MLLEAYNNLGDVLRDGARLVPTKAAIITQDGETASYAQLDRRTNQVANMLAAAGIKPGDRVALLGRNSLPYVEALFGIVKLGAACTPINWRLAGREIAYILEDSGTAALFIDQDLLALVPPEALAKLTVIVLDNGDYDRRIAAAPDTDQGAGVTREMLAMLVYTSGTTGNPKGAMLSHASFVRHCGLDQPGVSPWVAISNNDSWLVAHPLFHIGSIEPLFRLLFSRGTIILHRDFDVPTLLRDIAGHRVTIVGLVPTALQMVLGHPASATADFSSVHTVFYGASPIPQGLLLEALERLKCNFVQAYGMTEMGGTCVMLAPADHLEVHAPRIRSAGRPTLGAEIKIIDEDGKALPPHEVGEVAIRGSGVMSGYWQRPEATAETLDGDGWLRTGDAGYVDEDGFLYIHDRVKDMIISGGENIYPTEVENAVFDHPDVAEVAVVGVPHPQWGEAVKAVVVAKPGHSIDSNDVIAWARKRIASYKVPKSVDVIDELPKNAAGKILRRTIKAGYWNGQDRMVN